MKGRRWSTPSHRELKSIPRVANCMVPQPPQFIFIPRTQQSLRNAFRLAQSKPQSEDSRHSLWPKVSERQGYYAYQQGHLYPSMVVARSVVDIGRQMSRKTNVRWGFQWRKVGIGAVLLLVGGRNHDPPLVHRAVARNLAMGRNGQWISRAFDDWSTYAVGPRQRRRGFVANCVRPDWR